MKWLLALLVVANCAAAPAFADDVDPDPVVESSGDVEFWHYEYPIKGTMRVPGIDLEIEVEIPPGYYFSEGAYNTLNTEMTRLQDTETRLKAENDSLRASAGTSWQGYAVSIGIGIIAGAVGVWAL